MYAMKTLHFLLSIKVCVDLIENLFINQSYFGRQHKRKGLAAESNKWGSKSIVILVVVVVLKAEVKAVVLKNQISENILLRFKN